MKVECDLNDVFEVTNQKLQSPGLLLTSVGLDGRYNVMTIGWGLVGRMWREPVFMVAVRPSTYTLNLIEETNEFTVNVPRDGMEEIVDYCVTVSGRDHDKFEEKRLTTEQGKRVMSPIIDSCRACFECKVMGKSEVVPELLSGEVIKRHYLSGNYHIIYFGRILSTLIES